MEPMQVSYRMDGRPFTGWLADGSAGRVVPGVLVGHEGPGITDHVRERTAMLAELGYVAFAADLYGEVEPPLERAKELVRAMRADRALLRRRAGAALDVLLAHPHVDAARLAAVGFCFGGMAVLELARSGAPLRAVVGFHADLTSADPALARAIRGRVLVCTGAADPIVDAAQRAAFAAEMSAAGVDWQMHVHGRAGHSFTNRGIDAFGFPGFAYDATADRRSWAAMRQFLEEALT
jgi:dienelactone hydrolase